MIVLGLHDGHNASAALLMDGGGLGVPAVGQISVAHTRASLRPCRAAILGVHFRG
jgi:hypothetical protein